MTSSNIFLTPSSLHGVELKVQALCYRFSYAINTYSHIPPLSIIKSGFGILQLHHNTVCPQHSSSPNGYSLPPSSAKKNQPLSNVLPTLNSEEPVRKKQKQSYGPRRSTTDKLATIFNAIRDANWTLGEFLYYTFQTKDKNGQDVKRTTQHSMYATHFLQGQTTYTPGIILECWYHSADGRVHGGLAQEVPMYATTPVYTKIKPARAALTAFAAQIVEKKLVQEARKAVQPESGRKLLKNPHR